MRALCSQLQGCVGWGASSRRVSGETSTRVCVMCCVVGGARLAMLRVHQLLTWNAQTLHMSPVSKTAEACAAISKCMCAHLSLCKNSNSCAECARGGMTVLGRWQLAAGRAQWGLLGQQCHALRIAALDMYAAATEIAVAICRLPSHAPTVACFHGLSLQWLTPIQTQQALADTHHSYHAGDERSQCVLLLLKPHALYLALVLHGCRLLCRTNRCTSAATVQPACSPLL